jgi:CheY-like chemotaxis protein
MKDRDMLMSTTENLRALNECAFRNMGVSILGVEGGRSEALQVLIVEDDAADLYLLKTALADNPRVTDIVVAQDGVEALELVDSGAVIPDLAIIDLHMPRKDGFSLLLELRLRQTATFPSIVLTSSRSAADAMRSRSRGAELFLVKPDSLGKLTALMDDVISVL